VSTRAYTNSLRNQPLGQHRRTWLRPSHLRYNTFLIGCTISPAISIVLWIWIRNWTLRRMKLYCCLSVGTMADSWWEFHPVTFSQNHSRLVWDARVFEMCVLDFKPCFTYLNGVLTWFFEYKRFLRIYFEYQIEGCTILFCFSFVFRKHKPSLFSRPWR
jgi:hypothetical protein